MPKPADLADVRSAYDTVAEAYAEALPDVSFESAEDLAMIDAFAARLSSSPGERVIDAGCGTGRLTGYLKAAGLEVTGVDLSPGMLTVARRLHPGLVFSEGELTDLPAPDAAVDGVLSWYSIIHSAPEHLPAIAREFRRILCPGGVALVAFQAGSGHRTLRCAYGHDVVLRAQLHTPADVVRHFTGQGFALEARLIRPARESEIQPQAALLFRKRPGDVPAAPSRPRPLLPAR